MQAKLSSGNLPLLENAKQDAYFFKAEQSYTSNFRLTKEFHSLSITVEANKRSPLAGERGQMMTNNFAKFCDLFQNMLGLRFPPEVSTVTHPPLTVPYTLKLTS